MYTVIFVNKEERFDVRSVVCVERQICLPEGRILRSACVGFLYERTRLVDETGKLSP
jgi:hypothetical protein